MPDYLAEAYQSALAALINLATARGADPWDQATTIAISAAVAVAKGHLRLAEALMNLDDDWIMRISADDRE